MTIRHDYSLLHHNTFGIDIKAHHYAEYESEEELCAILADIPDDQEILHIGGGSNLLFTHDFNGTILHSAIRTIEVIEEEEEYVLVRVGSGMVWDDFVAYTVDKGWGGIENLSLIPGEVGASAVQNIGAYGVEAKDTIALVEAVELRSGQKRVFGNAECNYAYRYSIFKDHLKNKYAVTHVTYRLSKSPVIKTEYGNIRARLTQPDCTIKDVRDAIVSIRNEKLPDTKVLGNAGSFFMNPIVSEAKFQELLAAYPDMPHYNADGGIKIPAGWMIDQCGWKGKSLGNAGVYQHQALVLVNLGGASAEEIIRLSDAVRASVMDKFGISIKPEVNFI